MLVLAICEVGPLEQLAQPAEELRLEGTHREVAAVGGLVDAVAGEAAREEPLDRLPVEAMGDQVVSPVRMRAAS